MSQTLHRTEALSYPQAVQDSNTRSESSIHTSEIISDQNARSEAFSKNTLFGGNDITEVRTESTTHTN